MSSCNFFARFIASSRLDYTLPKFLGSKAYFKKTYARPIQGERDQAVANRFRRLVTENTFEDEIDALIQSKRDLADLSVGSGESFVGRMSNAELAELVRL